MFRWFASRFIKNWDETDKPQVRMAYGQMASVLSIGSNVLLCALKMATGLAAGSVAVVADGVNNLSDAASNIISLIGFRLGSRPADAEHPYGHGRYEYLAGLMVAVLILAAGLELLKSGAERVLHPAAPEVSWTMAAALAASILVKLWMMAFNLEAGRRIGSKTLTATAMDSRNDAVATSVVLLGMAAARFTGADLDGWLGLGVAVFVLYSGFTLVRDTLDPLIGRKPEPEVIDAIRERILACPGVLSTHDLMLHDYGPGQRFAAHRVPAGPGVPCGHGGKPPARPRIPAGKAHRQAGHGPRPEPYQCGGARSRPVRLLHTGGCGDTGAGAAPGAGEHRPGAVPRRRLPHHHRPGLYGPAPLIRIGISSRKTAGLTDGLVALDDCVKFYSLIE